ncbi:hypothetical protein PPL_11713 [Heterostelium album PN500]|uniref:SET domain-containing protein n=1 Tax=Heterostelium pallidum (strain ATCC 26659 / Pp 5 / PN500) TaxID=670386 RepID=D3BU94_HETP5|nr:hypothetical protein PPL_11713 [Heterostelium album PN500]EFA75028.1 hypothetical protein PPL_11713 [Heterostelium album PN500]|eukprot:XP_020427162.1 hypothetical protein PPL_11713 [Heterostelium album PN500]
MSSTDILKNENNNNNNNNSVTNNVVAAAATVEQNNNNKNNETITTSIASLIKSIFDEKESIYFCDTYCEVAKAVFAESLTTLTEFILERDIANVNYQISADLKRNGPNFFTNLLPKQEKTTKVKTTTTNNNNKKNKKNKNKSESKTTIVEDPAVIMNRMMLLFATATGKVEILKTLLEKGAGVLINVPDPISKLTPLHIAVMAGRPEMVELLEKNGADPICSDAFRARPIDYAYLRGLPKQPMPPASVAIYNYKNDSALQQWTIDRLERELSIVYCPRILATTNYLVEMCFSSMEINADMAFRSKYLDLINKTGGEENVILGWIGEQVGWGVYAARDIHKDQFIVRYGGRLTNNESMVTACYNMMTSMEDFGLDAYRYRSMGGMINHSSKHANAESICMFEYGAEQAIITATKFIPKGQQIFINYSNSFWKPEAANDEKEQLDMIELGGTNNYPSIITNLK